MTTNIFEQATRLNLKFQLPQGELLIQQLWTLKENTLIQYEELLFREVENFGKNYRRRSTIKTSQQELVELRLAIVTHILDVIQNDRKEQESRILLKAEEQKILNIIAQKQDEALSNLSIDELKALLNKTTQS